MPGVNVNWTRWFYASIADHLHGFALAGSLPLVVEFLDKRNEAWKVAVSKAEATISGPITNEVRAGSFTAQASILAIVTSDRRPTGDYEHLDHVGTMANAMDRCIDIIDYGATGLLNLGPIVPQGDVIQEHLKPKDTDDQIFSIIRATYEGSFAE